MGVDPHLGSGVSEGSLKKQQSGALSDGCIVSSVCPFFCL